MTKKIAIIIKSLGVGGAEKQSVLLAKSLSKKYQTLLIVQEKPKSSDSKHLEIVNRENIAYIQLKGNIINRISQVVEIVRKHKIQIVFAFLAKDNLLAALVSFFVKIKVIGGVRNCTLPFLKKLSIRILHRHQFDYLLFNNHDGRKAFIASGFSEKKSITIHNFIEVKSPPLKRANKKTLNILTVARFSVNKDYSTAFKAIRYLIDNFQIEPEVKYQVVGWGKEEKQIIRMISYLKLDHIVEIIKMPDDIGSYFKNADIYLCTSLIEGFSNSVMEALSYSLPVLATNVGDNAYMVHEGYNGHLFKIGDYPLIAEKLANLINDFQLRNKMGKNGYKLLNTDFSIEKIESQYNHLIDLLN